jgi:opacity protein-like surface antigen
MKKIAILFALSIVICISASAQKPDWYLKNIMTFNWQMSTPLNSNLLQKTSLAGGSFEFRHFRSKHVSFGASMAWNSFEQYIPPAIYEKPDGSAAIYSDMVVNAYALPILATAHYYFDAGKKVKPYAGLGIGTQYCEQSAYYNIFVSESKTWGFAVKPEVGALIQLSEYAGANLNIGYNYATNKNDAFKTTSVSQLTYSIGAYWNIF